MADYDVPPEPGLQGEDPSTMGGLIKVLRGQPGPPAPPPAPPPQTTVAPMPPPPQQAAPMPIVPPPPPTKSVTDTEGTTTVTRNKLDPGEAASFQEGQQAAKQRQGLAIQQGDVAAEEARIKAEGAQRKADLLAQHGEALKKIADGAASHMADIEQRYQQASDAYKNATPTSFWAGDDGGKRKFWAGIAMALGGFTESSTGGRNTGYEMIKEAIDRHDALEQARINKLRDVRDEFGKQREWELTKKHEAQADAVAWKANALDQAASEIEARVGQLGPQAAKLKAQETAAQLRQEAAVTPHQYFNDKKTEIKNAVVTKTQQIVGGPDAAGGGKAQGKMMEYAMMGTSIADTLKQLQQLPIPPRDELAKVKFNDRLLANQEGNHSLSGLIGAYAQKKGWAPMSRFKGVSQATADWVQAQELAADKVAEVLGSDEKARKNFVDNLKWGADDTRATLQKKIQNAQHFGQKAINLSRQYAGVAESGTPGIIPPKPEGAGAAAAAPEVRRFRDKQTGREVMARQGPDGKWYPVEQMAAR